MLPDEPVLPARLLVGGSVGAGVPVVPSTPLLGCAGVGVGTAGVGVAGVVGVGVGVLGRVTERVLVTVTLTFSFLTMVALAPGV